MSKSLNWYLRRHPLLYKIRFRLVSKESSLDSIESFCYNEINKKENLPKIYFELNNSIFPEGKVKLSDVEKGYKIAIWLRNNIKGGPGLGKSSETALKKMINSEGGVCSDFSQVFNNFCVINDLKVKEWGVKILNNNSIPMGGHSFNEFYSNELQKWVLIDVTKSVTFYHSNEKTPLSTIEFLNLKRENKKINFSNFNNCSTSDEKEITDIYLIPFSYPFLITNYCNKTYDTFLDKLHFLPESIIHGLLILAGKSYTFEFPKNEVN